MSKKFIKYAIIAAIGLTILLAGGAAFVLLPKVMYAPSQSAKINSSTETSYTVGQGGAPVHIVTYLDLLCDDCSRAHREILPKINKDYVDSGKAKISYKMLGTFGPESTQAATATYCANEQGKMLEFIEAGYSAKNRTNNETAFSTLGLTNIARELKLAIPEWTSCLNSNRYQQIIAQNKQEVLDTKGYGTPHFIINGKGYNGAPPYNIFIPVIDAALAEAGDK